jgi:hypothetical protein
MTVNNDTSPALAASFTSENKVSPAQDMIFDPSDETAHPSTPVRYCTSKATCTPSESEASFTSNIFSVCTSSNASNSSLSGSATPTKWSGNGNQEPLSESATPVNDDVAEMATLDPDQLTLRLYLHTSLSGKQAMPHWEGLAKALRVYFRDSWQQDDYTLEYCETHTEFLYSVAVADEKWRAQRQQGY